MRVGTIGIGSRVTSTLEKIRTVSEIPGSPLLQHLGIEMIEVQEDVILFLADAAAFTNFDRSSRARPRRAMPGPWPTAHSAP